MKKPRPSTINSTYDEVEDLTDILDEIDLNVTSALLHLRASKASGELKLTAEFVDALRCIVDDAADRLAPHYGVIENLWDDR